MDEVAKTIPQEILESSYSLGATRIETIGVVLRQIAPAIATATLLSIGRAIGDCAGVMFTAGFSDHIPHGLNQQAATLPLSVFFQLSAPAGGCSEQSLRCSRGTHHHRIGVEFRRQIHDGSFL